MLDDLHEILGPSGLFTQPEQMAPYLGDVLGLHKGAALAVARPRDVAQVQAVVRHCCERDWVVIPQGGNTGFSGGAIASDPLGRPAIVLSLERMDKVRAIDTSANTMIVEAGCPLVTARAAAEDAGRLLALSHGGLSSQIGGNLSTNAGGNNVLRYGMAREMVLGLEVVLPDGRLWDGARALRKSNAGYDLKQLFIGAEGTLGVITSAVLRLVAKPAFVETGLVALRDPVAAVELLAQLREAVGEAVSAFELIPGSALDLLAARRGDASPLQDRHDWQALIEVDAASRHFDLRQAFEEALAEALEAGLILDAVLAKSEAERTRLWSLRGGLAAVQVAEPGNLKSDTAVPVTAIPEFIIRAIEAVEAIASGCVPIPFGHVGDGNIHFNLNPPPESDAASFQALWPRLTEAIEGCAVALGGTFSAEHGIGTSKRAAAERHLASIELELMARLKRAIDPNNRLNPGKLVDRSPIE
jgi:FAD/FMN-containing dehydrogenase